MKKNRICHKQKIVFPSFSRKVKFVFLTLLFSITFTAQAQNINVTGKVTDNAGNSIPGVSIVEKGTVNGTITNVDGNYTINANSNGVLVFSFVGMEKQEIPINNQTTINVTLKVSDVQLDEMVVVGYGKQSRATITSSIAKVDEDEITATTTGNALVALQGKVAGVDIRVTTGQPGASPTVIIRGGSSTSPSADGPLYVIDGVTRSDMNDFNPEDIESMQVLKDAAAAAIYGARAANGVILITTKSGKKGTSTLSIKHGITRSTQSRKFPLSSAADYVWASRIGAYQQLDDTKSQNRLGNASFAYGTGNAYYSGKQGEGYGNALGTLAFLDDLIEVEGQSYVDNLLNNQGYETMTDPVTGRTLILKDNHYQDVMFEPGLSNETNITFQGGNDRGTYYANLGYIDDDGLLYQSGYKRYSLNFNASYKIWDKLTSNFGVAFSTRNLWGDTNSDTNRSARLPQTVRMYTDEGLPSAGEGGGSPRSILHARYYRDDISEISRYTYRFGLDWEIAEGLHFKPSGTFYKTQLLNRSYERYNPYVTNRPMSNEVELFWQWMLDGILSYDKIFLKKHNVNVIAGFNATKEMSYNMLGTGMNAATDNIQTLNASKTEDERVTSSITRGTISSFFARVNYAFDEKYLLTSSVRVDGSSVFSQENNRALFAAFSAGWNVHNEAFWKKFKVSDYASSFKPRISWGSSGNDNISVSATRGAYSTGNNYLGGAGVLNTTIPNSTLLWESTSSFDIGADIGLINNKHTLFVDFYDKRTKDRLTDYPLPAQSGFESITSNVGIVQNKGFEIGLSTKLISKESFSWDMDLTFSMNRTYVLKLPDNGKEKNRIGGATVYNPKTSSYEEVGGLAEGERIGSRWMYDMIGIYQTDAEAANAPYDAAASGNKLGKPKNAGDAIWADLDGNNRIDTKDLVFVGYVTPDKIGSIINSFSYKGLSLRVVMNYAMGHIISNGWRARMNGNARNRVCTSEDITNGNVWWPTEYSPYEGYNPANAIYPRYSTASDWDVGYRNHIRVSPLGNNTHYGTDNTAYVSKGDYLSFSEISLSYDLSQKILKKIPVKNVNFQLGVYNIGYITKYDGMSPEQYLGLEIDVYPRPLQVNLTTLITF